MALGTQKQQDCASYSSLLGSMILREPNKPIYIATRCDLFPCMAPQPTVNRGPSIPPSTPQVRSHNSRADMQDQSQGEHQVLDLEQDKQRISWEQEDGYGKSNEAWPGSV